MEEVKNTMSGLMQVTFPLCRVAQCTAGAHNGQGFRFSP